MKFIQKVFMKILIISAFVNIITIAIAIVILIDDHQSRVSYSIKTNLQHNKDRLNLIYNAVKSQFDLFLRDNEVNSFLFQESIKQNFDDEQMQKFIANKKSSTNTLKNLRDNLVEAFGDRISVYVYNSEYQLVLKASENDYDDNNLDFNSNYLNSSQEDYDLDRFRLIDQSTDDLTIYFPIVKPPRYSDEVMGIGKKIIDIRSGNHLGYIYLYPKISILYESSNIYYDFNSKEYKILDKLKQEFIITGDGMVINYGSLPHVNVNSINMNSIVKEKKITFIHTLIDFFTKWKFSASEEEYEWDLDIEKIKIKNNINTYIGSTNLFFDNSLNTSVIESFKNQNEKFFGTYKDAKNLGKYTYYIDFGYYEKFDVFIVLLIATSIFDRYLFIFSWFFLTAIIIYVFVFFILLNDVSYGFERVTETIKRYSEDISHGHFQRRYIYSNEKDEIFEMLNSIKSLGIKLDYELESIQNKVDRLKVIFNDFISKDINPDIEDTNDNSIIYEEDDIL